MCSKAQDDPKKTKREKRNLKNSKGDMEKAARPLDWTQIRTSPNKRDIPCSPVKRW